MFRAKTKYAVRAMRALAKRYGEGAVSTPDIAASERLPRRFLENIFLMLRDAGLVESDRGKLGGYALARPPQQISLADVMRAVGGPLLRLPCASGRRCEECPPEVKCVIAPIAKRAADLLDELFGSIMLSDLIDPDDEDDT